VGQKYYQYFAECHRKQSPCLCPYLQGLEELENNLRSYFARKINQPGYDDPTEDFAFNVFELDAASNNSVDDIRSLIDQVRIPPQTGKYKVYIIDEVHMLSSAAFNAFLKTLEEPPKHAIFILATTEKHKIIPTILSRCQILTSRESLKDAKEHLAEVTSQIFEDDALHIIAQKADGAMRDAPSILIE
jgi:DNA polymerase-3 subunit gamma/tau